MASFGERGTQALAAYREAQEEEAARLCSLRAAGVQDDGQYLPVDWDAPHGAWLVPVPELLDVATPDWASGRAKRGAFEAAKNARTMAAADEALELMADLLRDADDVLDEREVDAEHGGDEDADGGENAGGDASSSDAASGCIAAVQDEAIDEALQEMYNSILITIVPW